MHIQVENNGAEKRLRIQGEIVAATSGQLRDALIGLADGGTQSLIIDLAGVPFIDSSGLGVFVGSRAHLGKRGIKMTLVNPSPNVLRLFELSRLARIFGLE